MSNLTLARFVRPIDSWKRGVTSENILPTRRHFRKYCFPAIGGESEGHSPEAWSRGWPLVTAKRADSLARRVGERFGERIRTHRNAWFPSSLRASDADDDLGTQFWSGRLPVDDFCAPLVFKRYQQPSTQPAEAPLQGS
jgi:hypothetical protein